MFKIQEMTIRLGLSKTTLFFFFLACFSRFSSMLNFQFLFNLSFRFQMGIKNVPVQESMQMLLLIQPQMLIEEILPVSRQEPCQEIPEGPRE